MVLAFGGNCLGPRSLMRMRQGGRMYKGEWRREKSRRRWLKGSESRSFGKNSSRGSMKIVILDLEQYLSLTATLQPGLGAPPLGGPEAISLLQVANWLEQLITDISLLTARIAQASRKGDSPPAWLPDTRRPMGSSSRVPSQPWPRANRLADIKPRWGPRPWS